MMVLPYLWLAALQGLTELFPVSSLGHSVLVPALLHWPIDRHAPAFLPFLVVLHVGTASALLLYFRRDWARLIGGFISGRGRPSHPEAGLLWRLAWASVPAGLLGLLFEHWLRRIFGGYTVIAIALALNGVILLVGDRVRKRHPGQHTLAHLTFGQAFAIGCAQALALIPGLSRSGVTLTAGLALGLDYSAAAHFSFLMATPIIGAAALLEVPKLLHHHLALPAGVLIASGVLAGVCAYGSTWFLMRYFRDEHREALRPFAYYCLAFAAFALGWVVLGPGI